MKKILIIKHGSLGDIISSTGVLKCIRNHFKDSEIHLLTTKKYRDVLSVVDFIITPSVSGNEVLASPILVHFENMKQRLHTDKTFQLSSVDNKIQLKGPELAEATYPQKLGM